MVSYHSCIIDETYYLVPEDQLRDLRLRRISTLDQVYGGQIQDGRLEASRIGDSSVLESVTDYFVRQLESTN